MKACTPGVQVCSESSLPHLSNCGVCRALPREEWCQEAISVGVALVLVEAASSKVLPCSRAPSFLAQVFHKIITSGHQRLQPLFDCLLTIVVNGELCVGGNHSPQCSHCPSLCPQLCSLTLPSACYWKLILSSLCWKGQCR